jgi:hypothetical protein
VKVIIVIVWVVDAQHHTVVCSNYSVKHACSYVLGIAIVLHSTIEPMSHVWLWVGVRVRILVRIRVVVRDKIRAG